MLSFIIHNPLREDRAVNVAHAKELIHGLQVFPAIVREDPMVGCAMSHHAVIQMAKEASEPVVWVLEDDVLFAGCDSAKRFEYLVENWLLDSTFGILTGGGATAGDVVSLPFSGVLEVRSFSSSHCYAVKREAYDRILETSVNQHIDGVLASLAGVRKAITVPFVAVQSPSYSDLVKRDTDYLATFSAQEKQLLDIMRHRICAYCDGYLEGGHMHEGYYYWPSVD